MDPTTPRCHRSKPSLTTTTTTTTTPGRTPRAKSSTDNNPRVPMTPSTPRTKSATDFRVSTPSTVQSDSTGAFEDDFPFDSSGEWSLAALQTPKPVSPRSITKKEWMKIQAMACSPLITPQQPPNHQTRRSLSVRTEHSNESSCDSRSTPRRRPRRTSSSARLLEQFLVLSPEPAEQVEAVLPIPTPRRRRSSSIEPRRRRTLSIERRRTGTGGSDLPPRRRLSMTKIGSALLPLTSQDSSLLESPAARRLARHGTLAIQRREKPLLRRHKSADEERPLELPISTTTTKKTLSLKFHNSL